MKNDSKTKFSVANKYGTVVETVRAIDKKTSAIWAIDCVKRVIVFFEEKYPDDKRPRQAIEMLQEWIDKGKLKIKDIRKAAFLAHDAAREAEEGSSACSAARAAGHAVATAHVPSHSIIAANYSLQAIYRNSYPKTKDDPDVLREQEWQYHHLLELKNQFQSEKG